MLLPQPTFASLFSGAGGLDLGFTEAGARGLWAVDFDPDAVSTYRRHIGDHIECADVSAIPMDSVERPDILIGGPPCQGFSVAGHMRPDDPRSRHVWSFLNAVRRLKPDAFVMENVKNLAVNKRWAMVLQRLVQQAENAGYTTRVDVLNAREYGVPQARERMFLVGVREGTPHRPAPIVGERLTTVRDALSPLPPVGKPGNDSLCTARITPALRPILRRSPFAGMLFNGKGRPLDLDAPAGTLPASMGGNRTPIVDQDQLDGLADTCWAVEYHRHLQAGGAPVTRVPTRLRRITVQEAAAIQTFPIDWRFAGRQSSQFRQIGNAVPPLLARAVAKQVLMDLARVRVPARTTLASAA
jgi:DNA (cytosine-5)-methyltransferase 1